MNVKVSRGDSVKEAVEKYLVNSTLLKMYRHIHIFNVASDSVLTQLSCYPLIKHHFLDMYMKRYLLVLLHIILRFKQLVLLEVLHGHQLPSLLIPHFCVFFSLFSPFICYVFLCFNHWNEKFCCLLKVSSVVYSKGFLKNFFQDVAITICSCTCHGPFMLL